MIARPSRPSRPHGQAATPPGLKPITRPQGLARAANPGTVPEPDHRHLPAWVRRAHMQARPILADMLGTLTDTRREQLDAAVADLTSRINEGKFSQAFRYAELVELGSRLLTEERRETAAAARARHLLESARKRAADQLRDGAGQLPPDTASRLNKALRSAADVEAIEAVSREVRQALESARSVQDKRREREIHRTRTRIERSLPKGAAGSEPGEDWQDVLRRLQEQMTAGSAGRG